MDFLIRIRQLRHLLLQNHTCILGLCLLLCISLGLDIIPATCIRLHHYFLSCRKIGCSVRVLLLLLLAAFVDYYKTLSASGSQRLTIFPIEAGGISFFDNPPTSFFNLFFVFLPSFPKFWCRVGTHTLFIKLDSVIIFGFEFDLLIVVRIL